MKKRDPKKQAKLQEITAKRAKYEKARAQKKKQAIALEQSQKAK